MASVLLLDGGFSNELAKRCSYEVDKDLLWTARALITDPEAVTSTHLAYLQAGADIIETGTYQATVTNLKEVLKIPEEECKSILTSSVTLAKKAIDQHLTENDNANLVRPQIAGSVGPYGANLHDGSEYTGNYMDSATDQEVIDMHSDRIEIFLSEKVPFLALETMPALGEVEILLKWLSTKDLGTTKVWVSFVLDINDPSKTARGDLIKDAFKVAAKFPFVWGFGANCVNPTSIAPFIRIVSEVKQELGATNVRIMAYPNVGKIWNQERRGWSEEDVASICEYAREWMQLGASVIGGCCLVDAVEIKKLRNTITEWNKAL